MNHDPYATPRAALDATVPGKKPAMESHMKTARAHFAFGIFSLLILALLTFASLSQQAPVSVLVAQILLLGFFVGLHFLVWWGARQRMNWARRTSLVLAFLMLPGVPIGTLIGLLMISYAWNEWREPRVYSGSLADGWPSPERERIAPTFPVSEPG